MGAPGGRSDTEAGQDPQAVRRMFTDIAPRYDRANRVLSLGCDVRWRRVVARSMAPSPGQLALDLACGTGDLALALARGGGLVIGVDFTLAMLVRAVRRSAGRVLWAGGDAMCLPFADRSFDGVTVAFGLRNFANLDRGLAEVLRVLRPGGRVGILEFSRPTGPLAPAARFYLRVVVPALGGLVAGRRSPYRYLAETIRRWPDQEALGRRLERTGFVQVGWRNLTAGAAAFHTAQRPV